MTDTTLDPNVIYISEEEENGVKYRVAKGRVIGSGIYAMAVPMDHADFASEWTAALQSVDNSMWAAEHIGADVLDEILGKKQGERTGKFDLLPEKEKSINFPLTYL